VSFETIGFDLAGGVARLTLNRPDRLNSFTVQMHAEVGHALARVETEGARVLLLTGAGRGFCAGQDLADPAVAPGAGVDLGEALEDRYNPLIRRLVALPMPVICAVNGVAAGAGANLALACDIVLAFVHLVPCPLAPAAPCAQMRLQSVVADAVLASAWHIASLTQISLHDGVVEDPDELDPHP